MSAAIDVIVPVRNEEECLELFLKRIQCLQRDINLIFVDNASTDNTLQILRGLDNVTVIRHDKDEGYGGSIRDGIAHSRGDIIVIIDADCEYPPECIPLLVDRLERSDVVYASRFLTGTPASMPRIRVLGNRLITGLFNGLFDQRITDLYTGCKGLKRSALGGIRLRRTGFEHVLEMGVRLSQAGIRIDEIPVEYAVRRAGRSKMRHISETFKFFTLIVWYRFCQRSNI